MPDDVDVSAPETDNPATETMAVETAAVETADSPVDAPAEEKAVAPDWPEDWRDKLAKGDEKARKRLDRFQSPADVLRSWQELEKRMSSGEVKAKLPDNATDEQLAAWRKDNGIPEKPDGYLDALPKGLVIGDEDKPLLEGYLARVHGKNVSPEVVAETLDWYYAQQEETIAAQAAADLEQEQATADVLRAEWGSEYRANINSIKAFLSSAPADDSGKPLFDLLMGGRLADGTPVGSSPAALRWMARLASEANPAGFVSPGVGASQADSVAAEIAKIEGIMRSDRNAYNKDTKMQERLRVLYAAEEKLKG